MTEVPRTREPQYQELFDAADAHGLSRLGLMVNQSWSQDPKRTLFTLARYKFVAKILAGKRRVLEVGCGDACGTRLVQQTVRHVTAVDFDPVFIEDIRERNDPHWPIESFVHDLLEGSVPGDFDAVFGLDVLEHIAPEKEGIFLKHCLQPLDPNGMAIFGMPSLESQGHASVQSRAGHVNCKSGDDLKDVMSQYFHNVIVFSMNDEVVHTGFLPMAHYLMAVCCGKKPG